MEQKLGGNTEPPTSSTSCKATLCSRKLTALRITNFLKSLQNKKKKIYLCYAHCVISTEITS